MVLSSDTCAARLFPVWSANEPQEQRSLGVQVNSRLGDLSPGTLCQIHPVSQMAMISGSKHSKDRGPAPSCQLCLRVQHKVEEHGSSHELRDPCKRVCSPQGMCQHFDEYFSINCLPLSAMAFVLQANPSEREEILGRHLPQVIIESQ